jgi:hypothetical protein
VEGYENGVIADGYMRRHLTRNGFSRLAGVRPDDLFVYTDGDELILPEILVSQIISVKHLIKMNDGTIFLRKQGFLHQVVYVSMFLSKNVTMRISLIYI